MRPFFRSGQPEASRPCRTEAQERKIGELLESVGKPKSKPADEAGFLLRFFAVQGIQDRSCSQQKKQNLKKSANGVDKHYKSIL